jgi:hypothetical protein
MIINCYICMFGYHAEVDYYVDETLKHEDFCASRKVELLQQLQDFIGKVYWGIGDGLREADEAHENGESNEYEGT